MAFKEREALLLYNGFQIIEQYANWKKANHRRRQEDFDLLAGAVVRIGRELLAQLS